MKTTFLLGVLTLLLCAARPVSEVELVRKHVLSERVEILIPRGFEVVSEQQLDFTYGKSQSRPSVLFTNNNLVSLAFNYTDNEADEDAVDVYFASYLKSQHKQYKKATWFDEGVKRINNHKVGFLELMKPEMGREVYTLMFFTDVDGKLMICTFNCADRQKPQWEPIAKQIMLSLKAR